MKPTKISVEINGLINSVELAWDSPLQEWLGAFEVLLHGAGFVMDGKMLTVYEENLINENKDA